MQFLLWFALHKNAGSPQREESSRFGAVAAALLHRKRDAAFRAAATSHPTAT